MRTNKLYDSMYARVYPSRAPHCANVDLIQLPKLENSVETVEEISIHR